MQCKKTGAAVCPFSDAPVRDADSAQSKLDSWFHQEGSTMPPKESEPQASVAEDIKMVVIVDGWEVKVKALWYDNPSDYESDWHQIRSLSQALPRQDKRLKLLEQALLERDVKREDAQVSKVERVRQRKEEERDRKLAACQRLRTKVLRKMQKERTRADAPITKRDVIAEYADFTSEVYAPLARGEPRSLHPSVLRAPEKHPKDMDKKKKSSHQVRKELEMTNALKTAMESIKKELQSEGDGGAGKGDGTTPSASGGLKKFHVRNILDRPDSPRDKNDVLPEEEEQESAVLLLQRIIRGRAYQNLMFEGKEKRLDLINELRAAERFADTATTTEEKRFGESPLLVMPVCLVFFWVCQIPWCSPDVKLHGGYTTLACDQTFSSKKRWRLAGSTG
ncbi:Cfap91 [Symbiodinium sp. KB8]|nr:Cfap91 [Symbiodinium sp. KB8]